VGVGFELDLEELIVVELPFDEEELEEVDVGVGVAVRVGVGAATIVLFVAKYDALFAWKVHKPVEIVQVAGATIPSLVQPEIELTERTTLRVCPFKEVPTKILSVIGVLNSRVVDEIPHCKAPSTITS